MKKILIASLSFSTLTLIGGERKKMIEFYKTSILYKSKKKISDTRWVRVPCKHCHGTGHRILVIHKGNTSYRILAPCAWCDGKGTKGLSKK